jgi:hypothetical protein
MTHVGWVVLISCYLQGRLIHPLASCHTGNEVGFAIAHLELPFNGFSHGCKIDRFLAKFERAVENQPCIDLPWMSL